MKEPLKNLIAGVLVAALGVWIWMYTASFPQLQEGYPGPALFPRIIAAGLVLAGLAFMVGSLRRVTEIRGLRLDVRPAWPGPARLLLGVGLFALYPVMQAGLGFVPAVSLLSLIVAVVLRARLIVAVPTAVISTLLLYGLFTGLLGVPL